MATRPIGAVVAHRRGLKPASPRFRIGVARLTLTLLALAITSCEARMVVGPQIAAEVALVNQALALASGTEISAQEPDRGFFSVSWAWRFQSGRPASPLREALVRSLEPRFACSRERRHVRCSRALEGDLLRLDVAAHPAKGGTLVKAELRAKPD